jgi:hypothetical protein
MPSLAVAYVKTTLVSQVPAPRILLDDEQFDWKLLR